MATLKTKDICTSLTNKGFKEDNTHHKMYWLHVGDKKTSIRTRISHGEAEYGDNLIAKVAKQMNLTKKQLFSFVECTLGGEMYLKILVDNGRVILTTEDH